LVRIRAANELLAYPRDNMPLILGARDPAEAAELCRRAESCAGRQEIPTGIELLYEQSC